MKNNHRTIFTQSLAEGSKLDEPTARLIQYCYCAPAYERFTDDQRTISDRKTGVTLAQYVRVSMMMFSVLLVLEAASRLREYYSTEFYRELATLSPLTFHQLRSARIEERIWAIVRNQWFWKVCFFLWYFGSIFLGRTHIIWQQSIIKGFISTRDIQIIEHVAISLRTSKKSILNTVFHCWLL